MSELPFQPLIIVGAARSGTNMLRDAVTALDGFVTWPCDEINPIWRHGNLGWPTDAIPPERAERAQEFIRGSFLRLWRARGKPDVIVEKTCANTLRLPFVRAVLPEAKYVHIVRDGRDVVGSARKRWRGEMELPALPYYAAKVRYTPASDLPRYGWSYLRNRISMLRNPDRRMSVWGPRFEGMAEMQSAGVPLADLCAAQWSACAAAADAAIKAMPSSVALTLRYEDVIAEPLSALRTIAEMVGQARTDEALAHATTSISRASVGKGRQTLGPDAARLAATMAPLLSRFGYGD
ncbi:Sulfotransferase family protein [Palleronia marisminoris]|uniref:Sulfotransferase domain protein n=1 Tax=Palleronia marisminoris TaxID=315423 RepID=A0A1Y5SXL1_9RHOB|nr:sulfotransferase [Palleronia marisminoris]SFH05923.1 Sulfotransferase family protein [Palleronia marisminoris]SLN50984.1 Sulfotransferase domain protein [Palleronia marisminoris]